MMMATAQCIVIELALLKLPSCEAQSSRLLRDDRFSSTGFGDGCKSVPSQAAPAGLWYELRAELRRKTGATPEKGTKLRCSIREIRFAMRTKHESCIHISGIRLRGEDPAPWHPSHHLMHLFGIFLVALALTGCSAETPAGDTQADRSSTANPAAQTVPATGEILLIVTGDDIGTSHAVNAGTIEAYRNGIMRSANLIVPGPWLLDAAKQLAENPGLDVGLHLALTSEWERVKWRPLTWAPSLVDENGYFFPMARPRSDFPPNTSIAEADVNLAEAERELRAQIETAKRLVPRVAWISSHMGFSGSKPGLREVVERLSKEYNLPSPRSVAPNAQGVDAGYRGSDSAEVKTEAIAKALEQLTTGVWTMVDHPALDTPEMRAIGHTGYEYVAEDRSGVVKAWTSQRVLDVVKKRGITLTSWGEIIARP